MSDGLIETAFTSEVVGDRLQVRVRCRGVIVNEWCRAKLRIVVPSDLEVKIRSASDSETLRSLDGRVDAETGDGTVEAESLGGATRLRSANGSVRGSRLRTSSVQADSDNGSVRLELAVTPLSVIAHSDNGSVDVAVHHLCPGPVNSNMAREAPAWAKPLLKPIMSLAFNSPEVAAEPVTYLACAASMEGRTGTYLHMLKEKPCSELALEPAAGKAVWDAAVDMASVARPSA